jgi:hypothetical protein
MSDALNIEERLAKLKEKLVADGVQFVSEDELRRRAIARFDRQNRPAARPACHPSPVTRHPPAPVRMPYLESEREFDDQKSEARSQKPESVSAAGRVEREAALHSSALDYQADSQNGKLLEFFKKPHNFDKWFKATFLEEISGATRMNNRAIWLRAQFAPAGLYLDQWMISPGQDQPKSSHYRLCRIEDALSLTAEEKRRLIEAPAGNAKLCNVAAANPNR